MGTKLTYQGVAAAVDVEDHAVTVRSTTSDSAPTDSADPSAAASVVIPRWEVADVTVKSASLLGYGRLVITTSGGAEHTVEFSRDAEERFTDLAAIIG